MERCRLIDRQRESDRKRGIEREGERERERRQSKAACVTIAGQTDRETERQK